MQTLRETSDMRGPTLGKHCAAVGTDWKEVHWATREAVDRLNVLLFLYFLSEISCLARVRIIEKPGCENPQEWACENHQEGGGLARSSPRRARSGARCL